MSPNNKEGQRLEPDAGPEAQVDHPMTALAGGDCNPKLSLNSSRAGRGGAVVTEAQFRELSRALRRSMTDWNFKPQEVRLLLILCDETFEANQLSGRADLAGWSARLKMREDKLRKGPWKELCDLLVVDFNAAQGTFELRPDMKRWSIVRSTRTPTNLRAGQELPLVAERPVSGAYTEMSREAVLTEAEKDRDAQPDPLLPAGSQSSKDWGQEFKRLAAAISRGTVELEFPGVAENSSGGGKIRRSTAEKSAAAGPPQNQLFAAAAEKSAVPIASLAVSKKARLAIAAEKSAEALERLARIDRNNALRNPVCWRQWTGLCQHSPDSVEWLIAELEKAQSREPIKNPLGYIAQIARHHHLFSK